MRVGVLVACTQERDAGPPSDLDTSVVSGRSTASRHSVARLGGSLVHSSTNGVRDSFNPRIHSDNLPTIFIKLNFPKKTTVSAVLSGTSAMKKFQTPLKGGWEGRSCCLK